MKTSTDRILTSHVGSLPRPDTLTALEIERMAGRPVDETAYSDAVRDAVARSVQKQAELGIDIVDDGEQSKLGFIAYVNERLSGFEPNVNAAASTFGNSKEFRAFPEFYAQHAGPGRGMVHMVCRGPIAYAGHAQLSRDISNLKTALDGANVVEAFMPSATPASVEAWQRNEYYPTNEAYLYAIADAMREEYRAIIDAGLILQLDDPIIATRYTVDPEISVAEAIRWSEERVDVLNYAVRDLPVDRIRHHTCYGINMGPRVSDLEMKHLVGLILKIRAGMYSFEAANPRHEHEWNIWETVKLPEGKVLMPGVITQSSVVVEHPELVAQRIVRFADVVGRENVIAGADCGFASNPNSIPEIHPTIAWAKLQALVDGAALASRTLWKSPAAV